ncbi:MAG: hypothetical protein AB1758_19820 [Candidatus Eremiobacterota bacterium]
MGEDELRQVIETNFKLLALSMRDVSAGTGNMEISLAQVKVRLEEVGTEIDTLKADAVANQKAFSTMADTLEETLEAIKTLAFGGKR